MILSIGPVASVVRILSGLRMLNITSKPYMASQKPVKSGKTVSNCGKLPQKQK
jgi:hypothetical protein